MSKIVRAVHAFETETVRIHWTCQDGSTFDSDVAIPPRQTRQARTAAQPLGPAEAGADPLPATDRPAPVIDPQPAAEPFPNMERIAHELASYADGSKISEQEFTLLIMTQLWNVWGIAQILSKV